MPLQIIDGTATDRAITALSIIDGGGVDRVIQQLRIIDASGTDRLIYSTASPLSLSASPTEVSGGTPGGSPATTDSTTATPADGTAPYTYAWTLVSYTAATAPTVLSPTSATTQFRQTGISPNDTVTATFRCTVTDALSNTATTDVLAIFFDYSGGVIP